MTNLKKTAKETYSNLFGKWIWKINSFSVKCYYLAHGWVLKIYNDQNLSPQNNGKYFTSFAKLWLNLKWCQHYLYYNGLWCIWCRFAGNSSWSCKIKINENNKIRRYKYLVLRQGWALHNNPNHGEREYKFLEMMK